MSQYLYPVGVAALLFIGLALIFTLPWTFYQYRKYRYFSLWKTVLLASFVFYLLSAFFLISFPFPVQRENCVTRGPLTDYMQLHLFQFITDIRTSFVPAGGLRSTLKGLLFTPAFYQLIFNIALLFPLGVYLYYKWPGIKNSWRAVLAGFFLSLFFELSQLTGLWGIFHCPYRLFDVDDLFANTLGATLGFLLAPLFLAFFPTKEKERAKDFYYREKVYATNGAKLFALFIDVTLASIFTPLLAKEGGPLVAVVAQEGVFLVLLFFLIVVLPLFTKGWTIGSLLLKQQYVVSKGVKFIALFKRFFAISIPYVFAVVLKVGNEVVPRIEGDSLMVLLFILFVAMGLQLLIIVHIIQRLFSKNKTFYFDAYSGIEVFNRKKGNE